MSYSIIIPLNEVAKDDEKSFRVVFAHYKMARFVDIAEEIIKEVFVTLLEFYPGQKICADTG